METTRDEVDIVKRLRHHHVILFEGSYEWETARPYPVFNLLLLPAANADLSHLTSLIARTGP